LVILATVSGGGSALRTDATYACLVFGDCQPSEPIKTNVRDYTSEISGGRFTWEKVPEQRPRAGQFAVGPILSVQLSNSNLGRMFDANVLSAAIDQAFQSNYANGRMNGPIDEGVQAAARTLDLNGDGHITGAELAILVIHNTTSADGSTKDAVCHRLTLAPYDICAGISSVGASASLSTMTHELAHQLGTVDVYGGQCGGCLNSGLSLMAATVGTADRTAFHLDPWHKIQLGWAVPTIHDLRMTGTDVVEPADRSVSHPVILYDSSRGPNEFFIVEYRRRSGYDRDVASEGLAIWHVQNGPDNARDRRPPVIRTPAEFAVYHSGAPTLVRGGSRLWSGGIATPTLQWNDGMTTAYRIEIDNFVAGANSVRFTWSATAPIPTGARRVIARQGVSFVTSSNRFFQAENGGGSRITTTGLRAWAWEQFLLTDLNGGDLVSGDIVRVQTSSGNYVTADGTFQTLVANRTDVGPAGEFVIRKVGGTGPIRTMDTVSLEVRYSDGRERPPQYVSTAGEGGGQLQANRSAVGASESFTIVMRDTAALRTYGGQYVTAELGGGDVVNANRVAIGGWERFNLEVVESAPNNEGGVLRNGSIVNLRTWNGLYWVAEGGGGGPVNANRIIPGGWEQFTVEKVGGSPGDIVRDRDFIALRASNGRYVVAENGGSGVVNANRVQRGGWETFRILFYPQ
jgi:M6 family metalloprotease-like protein